MRGRIFSLFMLVSILLPFIPSEMVRSALLDQSSQATRQVWDIQRVDDVHKLTEKMGDHAAVYDAAGTLHVAYGHDHLYYARCVGTSCTVEIVDPADYVGMYASLALDSHGYPHIAYYDVGLKEYCNDEKVKYAAWNGSQWHIEVVEQGCLGDYPSIAVDQLDVPHVSYYDMSSNNLILADRQNNTWNAYSPAWLPSFGFSGYPSSLVSDSQGRLHLAFVAGDSGGGGTIWYTRKEAGVWGPLVEIETQPGTSWFAMAVDGSGNPHLAYHHHNLTTEKLRYTYFDGSAWLAPEEVADMEYLGWTSVMVASNGNPRLVYKVNGAVAIVSKTTGGWTSPAPIPNTGGAERIYLGQVNSATFGMTFYSGGKLKNTRYVIPLSTWTTPIEIDSTGVTGNHIAMAISAAGDLHVIYTDAGEKKLRYAYRPAKGAWTIETVLETDANLLIRAIDMAVDTNNRPHIVYEEYNDTDSHSVLKYLTWTGSAWYGETASQALHRGCTPSLALDKANLVYIAYQDCDYDDNNLTLAIYDGSWHYQTVDPEQDTSSASLYVNDLGTIYISYLLWNFPDNKLRFASKEGGQNWSRVDVASERAINTSLAFDHTGKPRIAFILSNDPNYTARLANWDGMQWSVETVATTTYWSQASLTIDAQNRPLLAYGCWYHPCYAIKDGAGWTITDPVDERPADDDLSDFGSTKNIAIGLSPQSLPVIVYDGELDLKIAELKEEKLTFLALIVKK